MDWVIIADDLTGACDSGAAFKHANNVVQVVFDYKYYRSATDVLVISTDSRSLSEDGAIQAVSSVISHISDTWGKQPIRYFKKIDSTLRGFPGSEFLTIHNLLGSPKALVAPAFPEQGRVIKNGHVYINGIPLEQTSFGVDITRANLKTLFCSVTNCLYITIDDIRKGPEYLCDLFNASSEQIIIADGETENDLFILAQAFIGTGMTLAGGSAGLARGLAQVLYSSQNQDKFERKKSIVLTVAGSRNSVTKRQTKVAQEAGFTIVELRPDDMRIAINGFIIDSDPMKLINAIDATKKHIILTPSDQHHQDGEEQRIVKNLAGIAEKFIYSNNISSLVLTGGETASAVCQQLNSRAISLGGEITPGIVWGRLIGGPMNEMPVVLKAGGFGSDYSIIQAVRFLSDDI